MSHARILVVDDEPTIIGSLQAHLQREGYVVQAAADGLSALEAASTFQPDLVVLDIMLPELDGWEVLQRLRQQSQVYVLILSARTEDTDKIVGLSLGADDYLTKPFNSSELVARVKAILRRGRGADVDTLQLVFSRLRIDPASRQVWKDDPPVELTPLEFDLLHALARSRGRVLSREQLIEQVWGHDYYGDERVADVHLARIRKKIEDEPATPTLIVTVRGAGYRFEDRP